MEFWAAYALVVNVRFILIKVVKVFVLIPNKLQQTLGL